MSLYTAIQILNKEEGRSEKKNRAGLLQNADLRIFGNRSGNCDFIIIKCPFFFFKLVFIKFRDYHHARLIKSTVIC